MDSISGFFSGFLLSILVGRVFVISYLDEATAAIRDKRLPEKEKYLEPLMALKTQGAWLGCLETALFFICIYFYKSGGIHGISAWLIFKVGSKWVVWQHIVKIDKDENVSLEARHKWGTLLAQRFLIGTLLNILIAMGGVFVAKHIALQ